ncbi:hypothetical protein ABK040_000724 [Willaertia magna]
MLGDAKNNWEQQQLQSVREGIALTRNQMVKKRIENEMYLRNHPEVKQLIEAAYNDVLLKKPETSELHEFLCNFFSKPNLKEFINNPPKDSTHPSSTQQI